MTSWPNKRQNEVFSFVASLKNCAKKKDLVGGTRLHAEIRTSGLLGRNAYLGSTLISMYSKCGALDKAQEVFYELPIRYVCAWNALLSAYAQHGLGKQALDCFGQMRSQGFLPDAFTYACTLKACGITKQVELGKQIHDEIVRQGLFGNLVLGNALVDMYARCGVLAKAEEVLDEIPVRDLVSWTALIAGYARQGQMEKAMVSYDQMRHDGLSPNAIMYTCMLKACGVAKEVEKGKQLHEDIASHRLLQKDVVLGNALVDMYAKCGMLTQAQQSLDRLPVRDVVSWNALITGYAQQEQSEKAIICYKQMQHEGLSPDAITYTCVLKAYGIANDVDKGKQIHEEVASQGLLGKDIVLGNALVDMYAKCGMLTKAQQALDKLPIRDVVSWNALITGYVQQEQNKKAMLCYEQMRGEGISPDAITYTCILKACGVSKEVELYHEEIAREGLLGRNAVLGNALVDMYAKCGMLNKARHVLDELPIRDTVSWSALMAGYAQEGQADEAMDCVQRMQSEGLCPDMVSWNTLLGGYAQLGESEKALACFHQMQHEGVSPDATTLVCVFNACLHSGLVEEGQMIFKNMEEKFGIRPDVEHAICMVNLYGNSGQFDKAMAVIEKLSPSNYVAVWSALMTACGRWGNVKLGRVAFENALHVNVRHVPSDVHMGKLYAVASM